jgi:hypothetical protein
MKRIGLLLGVFALLGLGIDGLAREASTITGEVIDFNCHLQKGEAGVGEAHKDCAVSCVRRGQTVAILAADGAYIVKGDLTRNKNEQLLDWVAKKVEATGEVSEMNGKKFIKLANLTPAH